MPRTMLTTAHRLVRGQSKVAGEGAFCREPIAAGEVVAFALAGRLVSRAEYEAIDWPIYSGRIMQIEADWFLEGTGDVVDFVNHCCEPNIGFDASGQNFVALRDLAAGEEVFFHYSTCENPEAWSMPCGCGAPPCRGEITGFRDLPADEKARLLPISRPYLRHAFANLLNDCGGGGRRCAAPSGSGGRPA